MKIARIYAVMGIFFLLAVIHLSISTANMKIGYEIDSFKKQLARLRSETRYINYLVAKEEALPRIDQLAKTKLNMVYPKDITYVTFSTGEAD
jgi:cell division protein FtsB